MSAKAGSGTCKANQRQSRVNKGRYNNYRNKSMREKNKIKRLSITLKRNPSDTDALVAVERCRATMKGAAFTPKKVVNYKPRAERLAALAKEIMNKQRPRVQASL